MLFAIAFPTFASKKDLKRLPLPRIRGIVASKTAIVCSFNHHLGATGKARIHWLDIRQSTFPPQRINYDS